MTNRGVCIEEFKTLSTTLLLYKTLPIMEQWLPVYICNLLASSVVNINASPINMFLSFLGETKLQQCINTQRK